VTDSKGEVPELVTRWYGAFLIANGQVLDRRPFPSGTAEREDRLLRRRVGDIAPEERAILEASPGGACLTRDRRLQGSSVELVSGPRSRLLPDLGAPDRAAQRALLFATAERALQDSWDPSVHLDEAVRAITDLDEVVNLLSERLVSWASRDAPPIDIEDHESLRALAKRLAEEEKPADPLRSPKEPELFVARQELARVVLQITDLRKRWERAIEESAPLRTPNLSNLLGPMLCAKLLSQAGGLERMARMPASTIQVLGAERAFFEHLRGHGPPPRHGLLFLHPDIQGAPRRLRGKLARALAGKAAIAARLDREGTALRADVREAYLARRAEIRKTPPRDRPAGRAADRR
jgi:nucleolar protein 56